MIAALLAAVVENQVTLSVSALTAIIVGVIGAVGALYAKKHGAAQGEARALRRIQVEGMPQPPYDVRQVLPFLTANDLQPLEFRIARLEVSDTKLREDLHAMFRDLLESASEREIRLTTLIKDGDQHLTESVNVMARTIHERIDMHFPLKGAPRTRTPGT